MQTSTYYGYWDYWNFYHKVTFDGPNKLILINDGVTEIDVRIDLYSDWKEWMLGHDGIVPARYLEAVTNIGGQDLPGARVVGSTFFLTNGWRIKPYSGSYRLTVTGNLYTDEGDTPFVDADGSLNNIRIESTVSTLVEALQTLNIDSVESLANISYAVWNATLSEIASAGVTSENAAETVEAIKRLSALIPAAL
jgi:hypothetical protein